MSSLVAGTGIAPNGIWFTKYEKSAEERAEDVSLAWGHGTGLDVIKPLKAGGAHRYRYEDFALRSITTISEDAYKAEKEKMKVALAAHSPEKTFGK
jgi:tRNA U34 5-methylaminomethyl-2-thiouridine-forming methyltransferase MnmC